MTMYSIRAVGLIREKYREAWRNLKVLSCEESTPWILAEQPDEAPFLSNGAPVDFILVSKFQPHRHIPWLEWFRVNSP